MFYYSFENKLSFITKTFDVEVFSMLGWNNKLEKVTICIKKT